MADSLNSQCFSLYFMQMFVFFLCFTQFLPYLIPSAIFNSISFVPRKNVPSNPLLLIGSMQLKRFFNCCYLYWSVKMLENSLEKRLFELSVASGNCISAHRTHRPNQHTTIKPNNTNAVFYIFGFCETRPVLCNGEDKVDLFNPTFYKLPALNSNNFI